MNYLAHAYLSFQHPEILVGNMISDHVKGKKKFDYPPFIYKGIMLHRRIDAFTDSHPATQEAKKIFQKDYRLYSGAVIDVLYDHFLAVDPDLFNDSSLFEFSAGVYARLADYASRFPPTFARMFPYMRDQNWLYHYRTFDGVSRSLKGLVNRAKYMTDAGPAIYLFGEHYQLLLNCYRQFWKDALPAIRNEFDLLIRDDGNV